MTCFVDGWLGGWGWAGEEGGGTPRILALEVLMIKYQYGYLSHPKPTTEPSSGRKLVSFLIPLQ